MAQRLLREDPKLHVLLTTQTLGAFLALLAMDRLIHQMVPWDFWVYVRRFLSYWCPERVYIIEGELWPVLLYQTYKITQRLMSLNFHLSKKSMQKLEKMAFFFKGLMALFQKRHTSCQQSAVYFKTLVREEMLIELTASLKMLSGSNITESRQDCILQENLSKRRFWIVSCIHPEEVPLISQEHEVLRQRFEDLLSGLQKRSERKEILTSTSCYIVDTFGELDLFIP